MLACEPSPGVPLVIEAGEAGVRVIRFGTVTEAAPPPHPLEREACRQLRAYFAGQLTNFDLLFDLRGTPFQLRVWNALTDIPYATTCSYRAIADRIGAVTAVRAVGAANGANPVAIVVPCHRVIGSSGKLTGYGGGLPLKQRLLELEARYAFVRA